MINKNNLIKNIPTSEQIHTKDPFFIDYVNHWSNQYYKLNSVYNSKTVEFILERNKRINDIIQNQKYDNIFDLFRELKLLGYEREEYNLIKSWISYKNQNDWIYTWNEENSLLYYIEQNYFVPTIMAYNNYEIDKSKTLANKLYNRIRLIDKVVDTDPYTNERISKIYLVIMVLNSPSLSLQEYQNIKYFMNGINNLDFSITSKIKSNNKDIADIVLYFNSVKYFRSGNYEEAKEILCKIKNSKNKILNELTILLKARCIFRIVDEKYWNNNYSKLSLKQGEEYLNEMNSLINSSNFSNFKNDITDYYLIEIKSKIEYYEENR